MYCTELEMYFLSEGPGLSHWLQKNPFAHDSQAYFLTCWPQGEFCTDFTKYRVKLAGRKQSRHLAVQKTTIQQQGVGVTKSGATNELYWDFK